MAWSILQSSVTVRLLHAQCARLGLLAVSLTYSCNSPFPLSLQRARQLVRWSCHFGLLAMSCTCAPNGPSQDAKLSAKGRDDNEPVLRRQLTLLTKMSHGPANGQ